jgi:signal transduction histidine kinase/CheY-like chemotaxis protein
MFAINIPTVFAFATMLSASLGGLLLWLWWRDRDQTALASWGISRLLAAVALPLLAARGHISDWTSIGLSNACVCLGYGLTWGGARQFEGLRVRPITVMADAVLWLIACESPVFFNNLPARLTLLGLIVASYSGAAALEFHRGQLRSPLPSRPLVVLLMLGIALLFGLLGPLGMVLPIERTGTSLPSALWFGLTMSVGLSLLAAATILLVALTKEQAEQRSTTALSAARDSAAEASNQKTRFLARMSHEIRTPLNGILGLAQMLANDPEQGADQRQRAATLEQAGRHLLAILNEVLDLSRIESGHLVLSPRPVVLADFLRETVAFVEGNALAKRIALTVRIAPGLPDTVRADPMRLRQILLNLLNNALKFTPCDGRVALEATVGAGRTVSFAVIDSGPGVPESLRPYLFQAYTQADGDAAAGGTGLGLAISVRLAQAMGGDVTHADPAGGTGSCFTLTVPLPAAESTILPPADVPPAILPSATVPAAIMPAVTVPSSIVPPVGRPARRSGLRILVVDDVALNRMTARALLRHAGHEVEEAVDGPGALAAIARGPLPDIVLMDQSMPGMDGHTATRHIRSMPGPAGQVPILAVTANALARDADASAAAGMDGHVVKPIELKALLAAIDSALDRAATRQRMHDAAAGVETAQRA